MESNLIESYLNEAVMCDYRLLCGPPFVFGGVKIDRKCLYIM